MSTVKIEKAIEQVSKRMKFKLYDSLTKGGHQAVDARFCSTNFKTHAINGDPICPSMTKRRHRRHETQVVSQTTRRGTQRMGLDDGMPSPSHSENLDLILDGLNSLKFRSKALLHQCSTELIGLRQSIRLPSIRK